MILSSSLIIPDSPACQRHPADGFSDSSPGSAHRLCDIVTVTTAAAFALPVAELRASTRRSPYVAFARQSAMYLAHVCFGLRFGEIGQAFGRDRTTAARACRLVEERRDDPAIDAFLGSLETACVSVGRRGGHPVTA